MKKIIKNRYVVLIICVSIVSVSYFGIRKAIDNYSFKMNKDIITEENSGNDKVDYGDGIAENDEEKVIEQVAENEAIPNEETDLVLEEEILEENTEAKEEKEKNKIYVYITGEVNVPGVVILDEGSRIVDAINAAEGTTAKANISKVNLVYILKDGMKVNIPNDNDLKENPNFEYITMDSGDGQEEDYLEEKEEETSRKRANIVNINTASQTELETLPGIGPSLALKIINYRKENGNFTDIEQLKDVSGIGESKFEKLKKYVTI